MMRFTPPSQIVKLQECSIKEKDKITAFYICKYYSNSSKFCTAHTVVFKLYGLPERSAARIIVDLYSVSPDTEIDAYLYLILMALKMVLMLL